MTTIEQIKALQTLIDQYEPVVRAAVEMVGCFGNALAGDPDFDSLATAIEALSPDTKALLMGEGG